MFAELERWLAEITGFAAVSLQPNSGAQGEYAGLLTIRAYHAAAARSTATSASSRSPPTARTRRARSWPASGSWRSPATPAGNIDVADLRAKAEQHQGALGALMVTYPSTHGVFEEAIREICRDRPRERRPGLHGRREHERAGGPDAARRHRRRRLPPEPAQDVLHPARRRRPRHGPDRGRRAPRALPARPSGREDRAARRRTARSRRRRGAARASSASPGSTSARWAPRA